MKKKLALSTTAIAVLASTVPTHVAPVEAEETGNIIYTKFNTGGSNDAGGGTGAPGNPFNLFKDALAKAQDGDTIVIVGKGFINDDGSTGLPFYIDKEVTIKAGESGTHLEVNAGGIVLGADVTFENIQLNFANGYHDAIFANGHTLNLKNVTRYSGAREIDLFAGGLYSLETGAPLYEAGSHGVINVSTDKTLNGSLSMSEFGNIYAGSMNGTFDGNATINLSRLDNSKKLTVKGIYSSGALEAKVPENWFGGEEPEPPAPMPEQFKMNGNVDITLNDYQLPIDGTTGSSATTSLTVSAENLYTYKLKNIDTLNLSKGTIELKPLTEGDTLTGVPNLNLATGTILDLTKLTGDFNVNKYTGQGGVVLPTSGSTMNIEQAVSTEQRLVLYIEGYSLYGYNGRVTPGQTYVTTANEDAPIAYFDIHYLDEDFEYTPVSNGKGYDWIVVDPVKVTGFKVSENTKTFSIGQFETGSHPTVEYTFNVETNKVLNSELWLDKFISKLKVNEHTAVRKVDGSDVYYRVEDLNMTIYFEPADEINFKLQKMVVLFEDSEDASVTPEPNKYDFEISVSGATPLKLTLDIQGEGEDSTDPTLPPVDPDPAPDGGGSSSGGSTGGGGPSVDGGTPTTPPTGGSTGGGTTTTPPPSTDKEEPTTPPSGGDNGGSSTGGGNTGGTTGGDNGGGTTEPTTPPSQEVQKPTPIPPATDKVNGVENLKDLDKELQQKVDSIVADTLISENGLSLNLAGDKDDVSHVSTLEVTKDGLFATVDGEKVKFNTSLDLANIDWDNTRVIRLNKSGDGFSAVPHKNLGDGLKISSSSFANLLITPKVEEPFTDVADQDWFKSDVEEMYNYGFTTGTTATTYSPNESITRAQFAVMLARAFELTPNNESKGLSDLKGKWYQDEAQALFEAGIIKGFANGTFGGEEKLTRQQAVTMIVNMLKYTGVKTEVADDIQFADLDKIGEQAHDAVKYLASQDILVNGEEVKFNPYNNLTRAQMAKMLVRSLRLTDLY